MNKAIKIDHEKIKAYLNKEIASEITDIREKDPVYKLLFELIDQTRESYPEFGKISEIDIPTSFSAIENMISEIVAGTAQEQQVNRFLSGLQQSSIFYERTLVNLTQLAPVISDEPVPELDSVVMQNDEKLLTDMGIIATGVQDESLQFSEKKALEKNWLKDWTRGLIQSLKPVPRYAYALAAAACIVIAIFISRDFLRGKGPFTEFVWDDHVPNEYDVSSFRGGDDVSEDDPQIRYFVNQFKLGMSDYVICNYAGAIETFKNIEPYAQEFLSPNNPTIDISMVREYYFYFGLSYLALGRSNHVSNQERQQYLEDSINKLLSLRALISSFELKPYDKENYFLGLAYWFSGNEIKAKSELKKISGQSEFYNKSLEILTQLKSNNY